MSDSQPVALITGASRGIGRAIALKLAREGYDLCLTAREDANLAETASEVARLGRKCARVGVDCVRADAPRTIVDGFRSAFGRLDVLINNAGVAMSRPFDDYTAEDWDQVMNVNARTPFFLTQLLLPLLRQAQPGFVVNMGSVVAKKGYDQQALYAASKHALLGFTKVLAMETVTDDVRVHAILPGGVHTEMITAVRPDIDTSELISPEEVAEVVANLIRMRGNAVIDEIELRRRTKTPWA